MLKVKVKVGNITNLSDARYCAGMGVDILGFPAMGPHAVSPEKLIEITHWVSGPEFILECSGSEIPPNFEALLNTYNASALEVSTSWVGKMASPHRLIIRLEQESWEKIAPTLKPYKHQIDYIIVSDPAHTNRETITQIGVDFPVLLQGVSIESLDQHLSLPIAGVALNGSAETQPGLKDYSSLSEILEGLETE